MHTVFSLSLIHVMVEKLLFLGEIFEKEILMDLHVRIKFLEFVLWPVISLIQKQITAET